MSVTRFAGYALLIAALQDGVLLFIGYEYASSVRAMAADLKTLGLFAGGGAALFLACSLLFTRQVKRAWRSSP